MIIKYCLEVSDLSDSPFHSDQLGSSAAGCYRKSNSESRRKRIESHVPVMGLVQAVQRLAKSSPKHSAQ